MYIQRGQWTTPRRRFLPATLFCSEAHRVDGATWLDVGRLEWPHGMFLRGCLRNARDFYTNAGQKSRTDTNNPLLQYRDAKQETQAAFVCPRKIWRHVDVGRLVQAAADGRSLQNAWYGSFVKFFFFLINFQSKQPWYVLDIHVFDFLLLFFVFVFQDVALSVLEKHGYLATETSKEHVITPLHVLAQQNILDTTPGLWTILLKTLFGITLKGDYSVLYLLTLLLYSDDVLHLLNISILKHRSHNHFNTSTLYIQTL